MKVKTEEFTEHYEKSGQLKHDLEYLGMEDNDLNRALLTCVVWSHANHVIRQLESRRAQD